ATPFRRAHVLPEPVEDQNVLRNEILHLLRSERSGYVVFPSGFALHGPLMHAADALDQMVAVNGGLDPFGRQVVVNLPDVVGIEQRRVARLAGGTEVQREQYLVMAEVN